MLQKLFLILSISFLLSLTECAHGPKVGVCISDPEQSGFDCSYKKKSYSVAYADSAKYSAYSPTSYQNILNYCAARNEPGTQVPKFTVCTSQPENGGFDCFEQKCSLNGAENGISCKKSAEIFVSYLDSDDYIATSESDNITVLAYCNIQIND